MSQRVFTPEVTFTPDGWYKVEENREARKKRDVFAKELKAQGFSVKKFSLPNQLISRGGIGSGYPHIETWVNCYGVNWS